VAFIRSFTVGYVGLQTAASDYMYTPLPRPQPPVARWVTSTAICSICSTVALAGMKS